MSAQYLYGADQPPNVAEQVAAGISIAAGLWLIVAPLESLLDYGSDATALWTSIGVGAVVVIAAVLVAADRMVVTSGFVLVGLAGAWAAVAPFLVDFEGGTGGDAAINLIVVGAVLVAAAIVGILMAARRSTA